MNWFLLAMKKYVQFEGRSRRKEYWYFTLFYMIIVYGLTGIGMATGINALVVAATFLPLVFFLPSLAVAVRRMHDVGKSGWFCLIPIYNIVLACTDSQPGPNQYGPNPKNAELEVQDHLVT